MATAPARTEPTPRGLTAPDLWRAAVAAGRTRPAYLAQEGDSWRPVSWAEAAARVDALAAGLLARGVRRSDAVAVLARTRLEWALLDWAIMAVGGVVVGLYPTSPERECAHVLGHSEAVAIVVEDDEQEAKIRPLLDELPQLRTLLHLRELGELEEEGRASSPDAVAAAGAEIAEGDLATLVYTSGTTGPPKGCMLTHRNLVAAAARTPRPLGGEDDVALLFLPLAHSYGRLAHQSAAHHGATLAFCAEAADLPAALGGIRPTILPSVPRVYEKAHATVLARLDSCGPVRRRLGTWALTTGVSAGQARREGQALPFFLRAQLRVADRIVFTRVRAGFGGRLRVGISGAAPLALDVLEFFDAAGVTVVEGYGMTENASSCTVNLPGEARLGTVGRPVDGCEIRVAPDGEILTRSETTFAGYFKDPEATREALTGDGWLRTGDVGVVDADGYLRITDRKKDLIITAGGKNIAPQNLENALRRSRYVSQAIVVGDRRPYVTALIALDEAAVTSAGDDPVRLVQALVDGVNRDLARVAQIKRFAIVPRDFSQEEGEVTPTLKLKRRVVLEHFADTIESLYADAGAPPQPGSPPP